MERVGHDKQLCTRSCSNKQEGEVSKFFSWKIPNSEITANFGRSAAVNASTREYAELPVKYECLAPPPEWTATVFGLTLETEMLPTEGEYAQTLESGVPLVVFHLSGPAVPASPEVRHPYPAPCHGAEQLTKNWAPFKALRQHYGGTRFSEQRQLHLPQKHKATVADSTLRVEMNGLEEQADNAKARELFWKPLSWLGTIRPTSANDAFDPALWETFVSTTLGLGVPILAALPRLNNTPLAKCGCKKFCMDFHGDHTSTCTSHSGATKAHDWMVSVIGPLFRTAGHLVRTQHGVTASAGQRRGDVEVRSFLRDQAGSRSLVFDLSITHDRFGSSSHVQQNGSLSHPQDLDGPMRVAAQRKTNAYRQTYADNQNISFLPAIMSTSNRMHGEFLRLLFLQAHRETEAHFTAAGMPSQRNQSE
jgi:hypothetical protein